MMTDRMEVLTAGFLYRRWTDVRGIVFASAIEKFTICGRSFVMFCSCPGSSGEKAVLCFALRMGGALAFRDGGSEPAPQRHSKGSALNAHDASLPRLQHAISYAFTAHAGQVRKGTMIPYASHLLAVCAIVQEHGGDEDLACAAMLHDTIEDCGAAHGPAIEAQFGPRVARVVRDCSDTEVQPKPPWQARKEAYLAHLEEADADTLLVSCADKLHNARAIVTDLRTHGPAMLGRFNAPSGGTSWYYQALAEVFARRMPGPLARELALVAGELTELAVR